MHKVREPRPTKKPFTPSDRHEMTSYDMNVTDYSGSKVAEQKRLRTEKRTERQDLFWEQLYGRKKYEHSGHLDYNWGRLNPDQKLYAVQVMHWDPKVLAGFTKGMLKKRPNDPIAVFDLYGNRFFP